MIKRCARGIWDETLPGIQFNEKGVSNYYRIFERFSELYPKGDGSESLWAEFVTSIRKNGKGNRYDCIIGVSGGTDSSYLLHLAAELGLRPLAVTFDNGWSSDIAVSNIKCLTDALGIDLETYVVDYEEMKDILKSYMKAGLPWIDFPTDHAIKSILYKTAKKEGIRYILIGQDFRSEGMQPSEWSYSDSKQLRFIQKKFGTRKIKSLPTISYFEQIWLGYVKGIKMVYPFFFINYNKQDAQKLLIEKYGWQNYGGHHHENLFTKFAIAYWMIRKFGIDKRIITLSAQVVSGVISREEALSHIDQPPYDPIQIERDKFYTIKKLGLSDAEFDVIWKGQEHSIYDYP